ncbi:MAG: hypothetical protein ABL997_18665 [Planctomycetota bacterium]
MHNLLRLCSLSLATVLPVFAQTDRYVGGARPGAYPDLASAIAAAAPGDRILLETDLLLYTSVVVDRSVRIQPAPGRARSRISMTPGGTGQSGGIAISALTPGIALEFQSITFEMDDMTWWHIAGLRTTTAVQGEIRFDGVEIGTLSRQGWLQHVLLRLHASKVWLRGCTIDAGVQQPDTACFDSEVGYEASSCLDVTADLLVLEDCTLRATSGAWIQSHSTNCFGCGNPLPYTRRSPHGGFALRANTQHTYLVRTRISDGNGGGAQPQLPPCGSYAFPGNPGLSLLTGPTGEVHAYDFVHELGVVGQTTTFPIPGSPRGPLVRIGVLEAPLRLHGDAELGGTLQATITAANGVAAVLTLSFDWVPTYTPLGTVVLDPIDSHFAYLVAPNATMQWAVPLDPVFHSVPAVAQLFPLDATLVWSAANPSGVTLRLP